jgi:hypothetical protein
VCDLWVLDLKVQNRGFCFFGLSWLLVLRFTNPVLTNPARALAWI